MNQALNTYITRDEMESRRLEAAQEFLNGLSQARVARKFGVSRTTASRWYRSLNEQGVGALRKRRATGRPSRLTAEQLRRLPALLDMGAKAHGFSKDRWTTGRVAKLIEAEFGVRYDPDHVGRIMHRLGLREDKYRAVASPAYVLSSYAGAAAAMSASVA